MTELTLATPEQLTQVVNSLVLTATEKFDLNRRMANRARQFFRQQIRQQRDTDDNPYQSRSSRKASIKYQGVRGKHGAKHRRAMIALNTVNNRNMMLGFMSALRTRVTEDNFEVGVSGIAGRIGREHNEGSMITFTTRVNGYYNSKTGLWEGGIKTKRNYEMPKRTFINWTPALERELMAMAAEHFIQQEAA